jgi:hypothetical protein
MNLLVLILILTVVMLAAMAPISVVLGEEMATARAKAKLHGYRPLGVVGYLAGSAIVITWFLYSRQTGEWLYFAISATGLIGGWALRAIARAAYREQVKSR